MSQLLAFLFAAIVLLAFVAAAIWAIVDHVRHPRDQRRGGSAGAALGGAFQELDRLVARPSIEYVEQARTEIVKQDADPDGE